MRGSARPEHRQRRRPEWVAPWVVAFWFWLRLWAWALFIELHFCHCERSEAIQDGILWPWIATHPLDARDDECEVIAPKPVGFQWNSLACGFHFLVHHLFDELSAGVGNAAVLWFEDAGLEEIAGEVQGVEEIIERNDEPAPP